MISLVLFPHVAQRVHRATLVEFVQRHYIGKIQHINLLQLRRRTVFGRHHVQTRITMFGYLGITLTNSTGFHDNQIVTGHFQNRHRIIHMRTHGQIGLTGCHGTHINTRIVNRIHPNSIA